MKKEDKVLCLFAQVFATGGIPTYNRNFIKALAGAGAGVSILDYLETNADEVLPGGIKIFFFGMMNKFLRKIAFAVSAVFSSVVSAPDLIVCGHIDFAPLCRVIRRITGVEYLVLTHGIDAWELRKQAYFQALRYARRVVAVSNFTADKIVEQVPEVKGKVLLVNDMVDEDIFLPMAYDEALAAEYGLAGKKVILTVCRLDRTEVRKGYDKVIEALPEILEAVPDALYVLAGGGNDAERLKEKVERMGLKGKVVFTGFVTVERLPRLYNLCDVFVMPGKKEGFGIVYIEALACGKPVIGSNKDASAEVLLNGELGVLVDPDDKGQIADSIIRVLKRQAPAQLLDPSYLRQRTIELYGKERFRDEVVALIKSSPNMGRA